MTNKRRSRENLRELYGHKIVESISLGYTMSAAAKACGDLDINTATELYKEQLAATADIYTKQEMLQQELHTLMIAQRGLMAGVRSGDPAAVRALIQVMKQRSDYLGLGEGIKVQIEVSTINQAIQDVVGVIEGEIAEVTPLRRIEPKTA